MQRRYVWASAVAVAIAALGGLYARARPRPEPGGAEAPRPVIVTSGQRHKVTPAMLAASDAMAEQAAPAFRADATDGRTYSLREQSFNVPVLLVFIKDGCPCSAAAQPFFNRLHEAYGGRAWFFGVIDGDLAVAKRWAIANRVPFPILGDPELEIVRAYKVENSAYAALVAPGGTIERLWPGYSAGMLEEAGRRLARLTGIADRHVDSGDAPAESYSGCPFVTAAPDQS